MLRAQVREVFQTTHLLIEQAIAAPLDHALRCQLIDVLPRAAEVNRQLVAAHQNRSMRRAVAPLRSIRRRRLQSVIYFQRPTAIVESSSPICSKGHTRRYG